MSAKLVYGVGINDANYVVQIKENVGRSASGKRLQKTLWVCPFYQRWKSILARCYSTVMIAKNPSYIDCLVCPEWHSFMAFRAWMVEQDWENKEIDKDLLVRGNRVYGPDTCLFLSRKVNNFLVERKAGRGEWPIGVTFHKRVGKFSGQCSDFTTKKTKHLGYFDTPEEAHQSWIAYKLVQAKILASEQSDPRVAKALIERYENYVS